jgi:hypothetical protein
VGAQTEQPLASERLFCADLKAGPFSAGADRGWWRMNAVTFPHAVIEIAAAPRPGGPHWFALRFDVHDYPEAPSGQPWDVAASAPLAPALWPGGNERIQSVFNPGWNTDALYLPMDRLALEGHDEWLTRYACHVWDPNKDIAQYLCLVHELLNEEGYTGVRG